MDSANAAFQVAASSTHPSLLHISKPPPPGPSQGKSLPFLFITHQGQGISSQLKHQRRSWPPKKRCQAGNLKGLDTPALPVPLLPQHHQAPGLHSWPAGAPWWLCRAPLPSSHASSPDQTAFQSHKCPVIAQLRAQALLAGLQGRQGVSREQRAAKAATIPRDHHERMARAGLTWTETHDGEEGSEVQGTASTGPVLPVLMETHYAHNARNKLGSNPQGWQSAGSHSLKRTHAKTLQQQHPWRILLCQSPRAQWSSGSA